MVTILVWHVRLLIRIKHKVAITDADGNVTSFAGKSMLFFPRLNLNVAAQNKNISQKTFTLPLYPIDNLQHVCQPTKWRH